MSNEEKVNDIFPKAKDLRKEFDAVHTPSSTLPIPDGRKGRGLKKKPSSEKKEEPSVPEEVKDIMDKNKDELWDIILNENIDVAEFDKKLNNFVRKMPKTTSALKGVRELYEDKLQINELRDIIKDSRERRSADTSKAVVDAEAEEANDLVSMIPLLKKLKDQDQGKLGMEDLLWLMFSKQNKQSSNLLPIIMMMMQQNQQQNQGTNNTQQRPNVEFNQMLLNEIKDIVSQQQQAPTLDPNTMLLLKFMDNQKQNTQQPDMDRIIDRILSNNQNQQKNQPGIELILDKFNTMISTNQAQQFQMIMQQSQDRFDRSMEMIAHAMQGQNPKKELLEDFNIFKTLQGENRHRDKDEMEYSFKDKQLDLEEKKRIDKLDRDERRRIEMLSREERREAREFGKSDKILDMASDVIMPIMQDGLGGVINDIMGASKSRKRKSRSKPSSGEHDFSASDIDNL